MNINDIDTEKLWADAVEEFGTEDPMHIIFKKQTALIHKYTPRESANLGIPLPTLKDFTLDHPLDQFWLKHLAWCATEEIEEAADAATHRGPTHDHVTEELIDALHFLVELCVFVGLKEIGTYDFLNTPADPEFELGAELDGFSHRMCFPRMTFTGFRNFFIHNLAMGMWQLRNKPWKETHITTDRNALCERLTYALGSLVSFLWFRLDYNLENVAVAYLSKNAVNHFRIRSDY